MAKLSYLIYADRRSGAALAVEPEIGFIAIPISSVGFRLIKSS